MAAGADSICRWIESHGATGVFCHKGLSALKNGLYSRLSPSRRHHRLRLDTGSSVQTHSSHGTSLDWAGPAAPWTELHNVSFPTVDGQFEQLDVYLPNDPRPGWRTPGDGRDSWRRMEAIRQDGVWRCGSPARSSPDGYVVVAPNYELSAPGKPTWPVNFEDVQAAVRWVRSNAGTLGINPNEIAAIGESAGANLAALLGTYSTRRVPGDGVSAAVDAVVAFSTPTDLTTLYSESPAGGPCGRAVPGRLARAGSRQLRRGIADRSGFAR